MPLSVAIISFNEERIINQTIESIEKIADEIIIVDSFSTDKTEELCKNFQKVKFYKKEFEGFGNQKNYALSKCIIKITQNSNAEFDVYKIGFNNILLGKILKYGGWGNVFRERLFKKNSAEYSSDIVHETLVTSKEIGKLQGKINHYTYSCVFHHIEKTNKYTSLMAQKLDERNKKFSTFKIITKPLFQFIKSYFIKKGFLDGIVGFYAAITAAFYTFLKYIKLYEIQLKR
jgi:glycosyltransferase involved in cell wall biosynthesis